MFSSEPNNLPTSLCLQEDLAPIDPKRLSIYGSDRADGNSCVKSYFSNEDSKLDEENNDDILELAEKCDKLKSSRRDLAHRLSTKKTGNQEQQVNQDEISDRKEERASSGGLEEGSGATEDCEKVVYTVEIKEDRGEVVESIELESVSCVEDNVDEEIDKGNEKKNVVRNLTVSNRKEEINKVEVTSEVKARVVPVGLLPVLEGFLKKKSTNMLKRWQKRYYVLKNRKLYYYESEAKEIKTGVLDFDLLTVKLEKGKNDKYIKITPVGGTRMFALKAANREEGKKWYDALDEHIKISKGWLVPLSRVVKIKKYWKFDRISETKFLEQADTGDILLFRTKNVGAKLQRSITMSEYDHVGLILRYSTGEIVLFEATGKTGVGLCRWRTFTQSNWHMLYSKLVYRKLVIKRTEELISGIEKFVRYSVGKKYKVSAKKLLKKKSITTLEDDKKKDKRTFFCSELIAACYKKIGLLPKEISAASYLPGAFAAERKLQLLNEGKLDEEYLIDFEL